MTRIALLFDLDGTLVDSDPLHHAAFADLLAERGRELTIEEYRTSIMGLHNPDLLERMFPGEDISILDRKEAMFRERLADSVDPIPGIHELLDWAEAQDAGVAVVTNAPRDNAAAMLAATSLAHRLPTVILGDECARAKPYPDPYQEAMRRLGVTPSRSVAFEDSRSGLRAARASGAHVFGIMSGLTRDELTGAGAHEAIPDFTAPALWAYLETLTP
ncbi:HAD superfamily hydrolase (TIGR01509 family) [Amaricoccus macauensis]|uniref:HAD superfamily hydrolase (TIGR01509 family) n=1 Tax=Amaricoccus macauensis TaxID=57001 RepID=A0A840SMH1_9RHOB|nr:HAD-IA family hydrolase [Amaricoccus macauensis]MBB5220643.1 HAD superfamily hydrolase (TIGR01509 family) [Amaricoccus macauensis]